MNQQGQNFTRQEQIILNSIFFLGECCISHIRTFIRQTIPSSFNTKDLTVELPVKLHRLQAEGWVIIRENKYYSCTERADYTWLKNAVTDSDFRTQLDAYSVLGKTYYSYDLRDFLKHIYISCTASYFLLGETAQTQKINALYEKIHKYNYCADTLPATKQAIQYLVKYPDFQNDLQQFPVTLAMAALPDCILHAMLNGRALPEWRSFYRKAPGMQTEEILPSLMVAAFLENDRPELSSLMSRSSAAYITDIGEALLAMLSGEWKHADAKFAHYLNSLYLNGQRQDPQIIMLVILALIPLCVISGAISRFNKCLEFLYSSPYAESLRYIGHHFSVFYKSLSGIPVSESEASHALALPIYRIIGLPVFCMNQQLELPEKTAGESIRIAKELLEKKQIPFGVYLLNAAGSILSEDDPQRTEIEEITKKYDIVPFFKMTAKVTEWENSLLALEKIIPPVKQGKKPKKEEKHISWMLISIKEKTQRGAAYDMLTAIRPFILHVGRNGKIEEKWISGKKLLRGDFDQYLSPQEQAVKGFVDKSYYFDSDIELEAVKFLENSKSVFVNDTAHPAVLIPEKNTILSKSRKDHSMELSLKYFPDCIYGEYMIFLDTSEEGICRYCKVTDQDKLPAVFKAVGNKSGKISIPQEGLKKLAALAEKMSDFVSFSGPLSSGAYRELPKIDGITEFHVQISRDQNDFSLEIRNKPCPEASWLVKPGHEPEQKILDLHGKKVLLERDLQLEKKKIREMLLKCPSFEKETEADYSCELDDPEQILNCLAELKETGFLLDWNTESPLKISRKLDFSNIRFDSSGMDWFSIGGDLQIAPDKVIQLTGLLKSLDRRTGCFVELDDHSYLQLTRDLLKKLEVLKAAGTVAADRLQISPAALPMLSAAFESGLPEKLQNHIRQIKEAFQKKIELPLNLHGTLRSYQEEGFRYLARLAGCRIGCCIADDMGLGKTIQLLALLLHESKHGPALVVIPASLCRNWEREAQKFAPSLRTVNLPVTDREKIIQSAEKNDLIICSYGTLASNEKLFAGKKWHTVILDEAQAIKNDTAKRTKAAKNLQADIRIVSTGTPVENRLLELWSIFDFLNPGLLGSANDFDSKFCINGMPRPELKKLISPLILRRKKEDVLDDLPPKTEITLSLELPEEERDQYETLRLQAIAELQKQDISRITILAHLTKLRRFCCDPSLVWKGHAGGTKLQKILELADNLKSAGHRALIFSQYVDFLEIIRKEFDAKGFSYQYLDGSCSQTKRTQSIDDFQGGDGDFFLISLKAGGTGLNLTSANYVILADPWWNPAVEDQAADRVHRIGQHEPVTVYRLIAEKTVEERIMELHVKKKKVSEDILDGAENTVLSMEELMSLFNT